MQLPSFEAYNQALDQLLQSLKYIKFSKLLIKLLEKLIEPISRLLRRLFSIGSASSNSFLSVHFILYLIIIFIAVILVAFVIYWIIRKKRKKRVKTILGEQIHKDSTVNEFIEKSKVYEAQGAYRQAVRLRFVAVLFYLHQNNFLYHDSTMTGKEMIEKLIKDQFIGAKGFEHLTYDFNAIWYGTHEIDLEHYQIWKKTEETFWQEVPR